MTKEELEKVVQGAEYDFLRENPHLGSNIMFLTLGGSHAYGTNVPGSDVDVRGVTGDSKYDLLGFGTFEQVVEQSTDTTIYGFRKLVSLLINCNPNVIEMLGSKPDNYLMVSPEGQMLLDNKALFLSKKALYSFGGYANDQLRRLQMGLLQNDVNTDMKEEFALRSVQRVLSGPTYSTTLRPKRKTISTSLLGMLRMKKSNGSLLSMPHLPIFRFVTSRVLLRP